MVRITDRPDMTSDVYCGRKALNRQQTFARKSNRLTFSILKKCVLGLKKKKDS